MKIFNLSVKGDSHYQTGLPCQDFSSTEVFERGAILAISDGHGSKTYVRSDVGSRIACQVALALTKDFIAKNYDYLKSLGNVSYSPDYGEKQDAEIQTLFSDIQDQWYAEIAKDAQANEFTPEERVKLGESGLQNIKIAYGCTLIVAVITADFTLCYQIGDGRLFFISKTNSWTQPVPWDKDCEDNLTTSLCMESPVRRFRYSVNDRPNRLWGIFGCSDGIEDCYGGSHDKDFESDELRIDYSRIIREYLTRADEPSFKESCSEYLSSRSKCLSHDDMSIAFLIRAADEEEEMWVDLTELESAKNKLKIASASLKKEATDLADRLAIVEKNKKVLEDAITNHTRVLAEKESEKRALEEEYQQVVADINGGSEFKKKFSKPLTDLWTAIKEYFTTAKAPLIAKFQTKISDSLSRLFDYLTKEINEREKRRAQLEKDIDKTTKEISQLKSTLEKYKSQLSAQEDNLKKIAESHAKVEQRKATFIADHSSDFDKYTLQIKELTALLSKVEPEDAEIPDSKLYMGSGRDNSATSGESTQPTTDKCESSKEQQLPTIIIVKNEAKGENKDIQLILTDDNYEILLDNESRQTINRETGEQLCELVTDSKLLDSQPDEPPYLTIQIIGDWPVEDTRWKDDEIYYISDAATSQLIWDSFSSAIPHNSAVE